MKTRIFIFAVFLSVVARGQTIEFTSGVNYTNGIPNTAPSSNGSRLRVNLGTGYVYQWNPNTLAWIEQGKGIDRLSGSITPSYTPGIGQSWFAINGDYDLFAYTGSGTTWVCINCPVGGGAISTDPTLTGDGSGGNPLGLAQNGAVTSQGLFWTGTDWLPSWGNPYVFVTSGAAITTSVNVVLIGTLSGNTTFGLPTCNAANDQKVFEFKKNGADTFGATIDPNGSEMFYDGTLTKTIFSPLNLNCVCRFSAGTGVWFFTY